MSGSSPQALTWVCRPSNACIAAGAARFALSRAVIGLILSSGTILARPTHWVAAGSGAPGVAPEMLLLLSLAVAYSCCPAAQLADGRVGRAAGWEPSTCIRNVC